MLDFCSNRGRHGKSKEGQTAPDARRQGQTTVLLIMARLTTKGRKALPSSDFAGPDRSYPVPDRSHAIAAKSMAARFASPAVKARVDAKANKVLGKPKPPRKGKGLLGA